jgi:hypothetical protein
MDDTDPQAESDLRRRAAWLLAMLALVAVLFVVLLSVVLRSGGGRKNGGPAPLDTAAGQHASGPASAGPRSTGGTRGSSAPSTGQATASCPTSERCALDTDIGNAVAAVDAYRRQHGMPAVPGSVSDAAKQCALSNGSSCSGNWAESQVPGPVGTTAVAKIAQLGKVLDPQMTSFGVGWAYDPQGKQYFFALVRNG